MPTVHPSSASALRGLATRAGAVALALALGLAVLVPGGAAAAAPSIGALIAAARPGETVIVPAGTYRERLVIDKPLTLVGEGWPVIDGGRGGDVVLVKAPDVVVRGFVVQASGRNVATEPAGIRVHGDRATIEGNRLRDVLYGIVLEESDGHRLIGNEVASIPEFASERRGHALYLWHTNDNLVADNIVTSAKDGVFVGFASRNNVERNQVSHARYGIHYMYADDNVFTDNVFRHSVAGGAIMFSRNISFRGNEFSHNRSAASGYGLLFKDVDDVEMTDNWIHHNRLGVTLEGAPHTPGSHVTLRSNTIAFNDVALEIASTTDVTFTANTFSGNLEQVAMSGAAAERNRWSADGVGNYWDEYRGYDAKGDGVGDIPFRYQGTFDELTARNEWLRLYSFTPARSALELAARWFPVYRPAVRVLDEHPLMAPPEQYRAQVALPGSRAIGGIGLGLVLLALSVLIGVPRSLQRGWR